MLNIRKVFRVTPQQFGRRRFNSASLARTPATVLANGTAIIGGGGAAYHFGVEEELKARIKARGEAAVRACRLVSTVGYLVYLYKAYEWKEKWGMNDGAVDPLSRAREALREAQDRQDEVGRRWLAEMDEAAKAAQAEEAYRCHLAVKAAAEGLARAEAGLRRANHQGSGGGGGGDPRARLHRTGAAALLELCRRNAGVYVKLGQHLAQLDYMIPREYVSTMAALFDDAPQTEYQHVREVIREELGQYPEEIWARFDPEPIASASLAQVHVAYDNNGRKLAVKVQHRGLRETSQGDIDAVTFFVNLIAQIFPDFPFVWLVDEITPNLPKELDFNHEGQNADRCRKMFEDNEFVQVPEVVWGRTAARVLCMTFEEGCQATDLPALRRASLPLPAVAALVSRAFNHQIFRHGFVHCDPHPANVLIRPMPGDPPGQGRPQMVLLDHGLYKEIDDDFRFDYCRLWRALVTADIKGIKYHCQKMGAGPMYTLLAAMLTSRPWDEIIDTDPGSLHAQESEADKAMIQGYAQKYAGEISTMLNSVPRQMLLLFKANDCLRHIDRRLGAPVNTFLITGETCIEVINAHEKACLAKTAQGGSLSVFSRLAVWMQHARIGLRQRAVAAFAKHRIGRNQSRHDKNKEEKFVP